MARSGSVFFPFKEDLQNNSLRRAEKVEDVFNSAIRSFLLTDPMSRLGNPVGSKIIPSLLHKTFPDNALSGIENELKIELSDQFKEITFLEVILERHEKTALLLKIKYTSAITEIVDLSLIIQN